MFAGAEPVKKKKYWDTTERIKTIVRQYEERNILDCFCAIVHNFQL